MSDLTQDQAEKRAAIQKSATIWGVIVGAIAGLLALWILAGQGGAIRFGGAVVIALIAAVLVFRASFSSGAKTAKCNNCSAAFSRSRTDHVETLTASANKEEIEAQPDQSTKVTTWVEDSFDVVDTYTCANCADAITKTYTTTRRRDEKSVIKPAEVSKTGASGRAPAKKRATNSGKSGKSGSGGKARSKGSRT